MKYRRNEFENRWVLVADERVLFHRTGLISSDKSRSIGLLIMNTTDI